MGLVFNPRQTVLISCRGTATHFGISKELDELFPCDWHTPISFSPAKYAVCVSKTMSFALDIIRSSESFVVNFMPFVKVENVKKTGETEGKFIDKFKEAFLTKEDAENVDAPRVKENLGFLECTLEAEHDYGDHILFIGKVVRSNLKDSVARRVFHIDAEEYTTTK